ncbi:MAG: hypothetical protein CMH41_01690 [Micrococcales bacterium]|nr:hypothetical protein [Micrococcales bacterium]
MATRTMKIAIVGGGPSGLTLASILGREAPNNEAFDITIFERGAADRDQGSGWDVDEEAQAALLRAGVELESFQRPRSDRMMSYRVDDMDRPIATFRMPPFISDLGVSKEQMGFLASPSLETERKKMVDGLTDALASHTKIIYESYISGLKMNNDGSIDVRGRDGSTLNGSFDVVIDSSGSGSPLRSARFAPEADAHYTGTTYVQGLIHSPEKTLDAELVRLLGEGTLTLYGPTRDGKGTEQLNVQRFGADPSDQVATIWIEVHSEDANRLIEELGFEGIYGITRDPAALQRVTEYTKQQLSGFPEQYQDLFDSIEGARVLPMRMHPFCGETLALTAPNSEGLPFLCIGDALHALPPWSGMSGNYALRDAADLATSLIKQQPREWTSASVAAALRGHERDFMLRTDEKRKATANRSPGYVDYMHSTEFTDFALSAHVLGKPPEEQWSTDDQVDSAVMAETIRFFVLLNSFDNYGMSES